jgi:hypothetical protein
LAPSRCVVCGACLCRYQTSEQRASLRLSCCYCNLYLTLACAVWKSVCRIVPTTVTYTSTVRGRGAVNKCLTYLCRAASVGLHVIYASMYKVLVGSAWGYCIGLYIRNSYTSACRYRKECTTFPIPILSALCWVSCSVQLQAHGMHRDSVRHARATAVHYGRLRNSVRAHISGCRTELGASWVSWVRVRDGWMRRW